MTLRPDLPPVKNLPLRKQATPFAALFVFLVIAYGYWLMVFWPGVLGEDSRAILLEVQDDKFRSGKPALWYWFVKLQYQNTNQVEIPIAALLGLCALILARILAWCWSHCLYKTFFFGLIFICLAPHMIYFMGSLYADGIYSIAATGLLFELWLCAYTRRTGPASLAMIALTLPFAAFGRPNGLVFLIPVAFLAWWLGRSSRRRLLAILVAWSVVAVWGARLHKGPRHETLFPLAIFETVNFLQPHPMNLWIESPRISQRTMDILIQHRPLKNYLDHYDPDYWDPLTYKAGGPLVMSMSKPDRNELVHEFFTYNLWNNLPKFLGSRVNVFLVSAFAQGGLPGYAYAKQILADLQTRSTYRRFNLDRSEQTLLDASEFSYRHRRLLWTPFLGMALLVWALRKGLRDRSVPLLLVALPTALQLGAIFAFSIAGEYRYLLPFFTLPLAMVPAMVFHSRTRPEPEPSEPDPSAATPQSQMAGFSS